MGNIPEFNRVITPDRSVGGAAAEVARAPYERRAQEYRTVGRAVAQAGGQAMDYMARVAQADNATWVNAQSIAYRKRLYDGMDEMRKSRESSPTNFHKDFDTAMETAGEDFLATAPTDAARKALQEQMAEMRTGFYDNNLEWEASRNVAIFGERMDSAANDMGSLAYRAGVEGEPLDSSGLYGDIEASVITGSSFVAPEKLGNIRTSMRKGVMQNYLQGLSDAHPVAALKALDDPKVQAQFEPEEFQKMKSALESRALRVQEINGQKEVLSILKDENSLLAQSLSNPLSYGELQKAFTAQPGMSASARAYFLQANGFTGKEGAEGVKSVPLSPSEKMQAKAEIYQQLGRMTVGQGSWEITNAVKGVDKMELTPKVMADFQDTIYSAMNSKVLTDDEGMMMLSQIMEPFADQNAAALGKLFDTNVGLDGLDRVFKEKMMVPVPKEPKDNAPAYAKYEFNQAKTINAANRVKLYDYYMSALGAVSKGYGIERIGDIPTLNAPQKRKLFTEAQKEAERLYMLDRHPALSSLNDIPNQVFSGGQLIQGAVGSRDLKTDGAGKGGFKILTKGGHKARRWEDGTIEVIE